MLGCGFLFWNFSYEDYNYKIVKGFVSFYKLKLIKKI